MEENRERLAELQMRVTQLESRLQEVGQQSKGDWEVMEAQLKVIFLLTNTFYHHLVTGPPKRSRRAGTPDGFR